MPKDFLSSLAMLAIGSLLVTLSLVIDMPDLFLWTISVLSLPFNVLGIVGIIVHSRIQKSEV